jgi:uncharacterized protein YjeT (DUF2065 family)
MPLSLRIMEWLGLLFLVAGLPMLLAPGFVRATFSLRSTPQITYGLRIVGVMTASLGLVLIVFARSYWTAIG